MAVIRSLCLLVLLVVSAHAQFNPRNSSRTVAFISSGVAASDPCTGCTNETYEGTGVVVSGWIFGGGTGSITNVDYATAPAPIDNSQSFLIRNPANDNSFSYINMPNTGEIWWRFKMILTNTVVNGARLWIVADNTFTLRAGIEIRSSGLRITHGTANATTVATMSANTTIHVWGHYLKGSGANGVADVAWSTAKQKPTSGNNFASVSTGTSTQNQQQCGPYVSDVDFAGVVAGVIYDSVSLSTTGPIGDFP